jgi:DNA-binding protein HU-beta
MAAADRRKSVNKAELVNALADRLGGGRKQAAEALDAVIDTIYRAVSKGEKVTVTGFGSFEKVQRAARTGRNPATGETIKVKKSVAPKFRPGQEFKNVVSGSKKLGRLPRSASSSSTSRAPAKAVAAKPPAKPAATKATARKAAPRKTTAKR